LHLFNPPIQRLKEDIKKGLFGKINYMHSFGSGNGPARQDMSALWDFFPHDVSIFLYLLDEMPLSVSADGASYLKKGIEDLVAMNIKFANNIFAHSVGTWLYPLKKRELILIGEKLRAAFDDYASNKLRYYDVGNNCITPQLSNSKPLTEQLRHFLNCIENNKIPLTDGMEALKVTTVLEAAQKSLKKKGEMVKIKFA